MSEDVAAFVAASGARAQRCARQTKELPVTLPRAVRRERREAVSQRRLARESELRRGHHLRVVRGPYKDADDTYDPSVVLDLDYWVLMPTRRAIGYGALGGVQRRRAACGACNEPR